MQKRPLQDVIPPRAADLRPRRVRPAAPVPHESPQQPPPVRRVERTSSGPRWRIWIFAVVCLTILGAALTFLFSDSKVTVYAKNRQAVMTDTVFEAFRVPSAGELGFETMSIEKTLSEQVAATGEEHVSTKASGTIVIFNTHSEAPQRLIKDTRFETPDGLIYRIPEMVTVPGQKTVEGQVVPGQIEVTVYADKPGAEYNIDLSDFTIPGFAGSPRFETFFARSKTPMTGGYEGVKKTVAAETRAAIEDRLSSRLREEVTRDAKAQKPDGFLLYDDAIFITLSQATEEVNGDQVVVTMKGTLTGLLFREQIFSGFLASNTIAGYDGEPVRLADPTSITVSILEREAVRPAEDPRISFSVRGPLRIVWLFDAEAFAQDIAGKQKEALPTVLSGYPAIERVETTLRPVWRRTFPENPLDITVVERLDG